MMAYLVGCVPTGDHVVRCRGSYPIEPTSQARIASQLLHALRCFLSAAVAGWTQANGYSCWQECGDVQFLLNMLFVCHVQMFVYCYGKMCPYAFSSFVCILCYQPAWNTADHLVTLNASVLFVSSPWPSYDTNKTQLMGKRLNIFTRGNLVHYSSHIGLERHRC